MLLDHLPYVNRKTAWVRPVPVAEIKFAGWTKEVIMRAPILLRFREEIIHEDCVIEAVSIPCSNYICLTYRRQSTCQTGVCPTLKVETFKS